MARSKKIHDSASRDDLVRELYLKGMTQSQIAREVGVSRQRIFQMLGTLRVKKRVVPPRAKRVKEIPGLLRKGLNGAAIARHYGMSLGAIYVDMAVVKQSMSKQLAAIYHENRVAPLKAKTGLRNPLTAEAIDKRRAKILPLIEKGLSLMSIGEKLGVTGQTIRNDLNQMKVGKRIEQKVHANRVVHTNKSKRMRR